MHIRHCITCFIVRPTATEPEFLLIRRGPLDDYPNTWQPLSGHIEHGESSVMAAMRHLTQTVKLTPVEFYALNRTRTSFLPRLDALVQATVFVAMVDAQADVPSSVKGVESRWVKLSELDSQLVFTVDREALAELRHDILDNGPAKPLLKVNLD